MILQAEIKEIAAEWRIRMDVVERDYVLGWLVAAIASEPTLRETWVFKGGTCLRKCYFETYRLSEDLDFTIRQGGPEDPRELEPIFARIATDLFDRSGIELRIEPGTFVRTKNRRGNPTTTGKIAFSGPNRSHQLPKAKLDLTSDEVLAHAVALRPLTHPYSDDPGGEGIPCYSLPELFAEKMRALAERCRPRDLYDVVHMHRHLDLSGRVGLVSELLARKCEHANISAPTFDSIAAEPQREGLEQDWSSMLGHQLPHLPSVSDFWVALEGVFSWLQGHTRPALPRAEIGGADAWTPRPGMISWRRGFSLELIRFAGANRLLLEVDYRPERGRVGPRLVQPYALRRSRAGDVLLYVVNDYGALRSYRVDRIAGVRPTDRSFRPRYRIEF